jgi:hypothetical protein
MDIKKLLQEVDFLTDEQKKQWLLTVDNMSDKDLGTFRKFLEEKIIEEREFLLKLIAKSGRREEFEGRLKILNQQFLRLTREKEEKFQNQKEESAEDILGKLKNI